MKRILWLVPLLIATTFGRSFAAAPVADVFREGLFAEEATRDLPAAIQAYEEVVRRLDEQRRLAATAVFRLGECHRKLGQTNEAAAAFERVVREFPDEETLVKLSRENLSLLRPPVAAPAAVGSTLSSQAARDQQRALLQQEIALVEQGLKAQKAKVQVGAMSPEDLLPLERDLLSLRRELARLNAPSADLIGLDLSQAPAAPGAATNATDTEMVQREIQLVSEQLAKIEARTTDRRSPGDPEVLSLKRDLLRLKRQLPENAGADAQKALFQSETDRVHEALKNQHLLVEAGRAEAATVLSLERELLALERQKAAVQEGPTVAAAGNSGLAPATTEEAEEIRRIQTLVANSPDLINAGESGSTPLMTAAKNGQLAVARYLLDHGARPDATPSDSSVTALHWATTQGHRTMAELLVERGAPLHAVINGRTPLHEAARLGFLSLAELLLSKGADVNFQAESGTGSVKSGTPLRSAVQARQERMVKFLLDHGADPHLAGDNFGVPGSDVSTPLTVADSPSMVRLLLEDGADPNADNSARLMKAIQFQELDVLRVLLDAGAKVNMQAVVFGKRKDGSDGPLNTAEGVRTPLAFAISRNWMEGARILREHAADVNLADGRGVQWTPLHHAVSMQSLEMVRWLLSEGAKVDAKDALGRSALDVIMNQVGPALAGRAVALARVPVPGVETPEPADPWDLVVVLMNAGADPMAIVNGFPVIHYASAAGRIDVLQALKEHGANLDARGQRMVTPLMVAVGMDQPEALDWLLKNGADVDLQDEDSNTALHFAAWKQSPSLAKRLLEAGASRSARNVLKKTPAEFTDRLASVYGTSFGLPRLQPGRRGELPTMQPGSMAVFLGVEPSALAPKIAELKRLLTPAEPAPTTESPSLP